MNEGAIMNDENKTNEGQVNEQAIEQRNPVIGFFEDNKKWFIIGGCLLAGVLLGGAGTMMVNKAKSSGSENEEAPFEA